MDVITQEVSLWDFAQGVGSTQGRPAQTLGALFSLGPVSALHGFPMRAKLRHQKSESSHPSRITRPGRGSEGGHVKAGEGSGEAELAEGRMAIERP